MVRFSFCGHDLMALPQGALYWPSRRSLLIADLHLEKASWFARLGQMLPPYDSVATLADLTAVVAATGAAGVGRLGGRRHERASGSARLGQMLPPYDSVATLADLTAVVAATGASEIWCLGDSFHD